MYRFLIVILLFAFAVPSQDHLDQLARSGSVDKTAPVKSSAEITINAPPEKVWRLLTDVRAWPQWQRNIASTEIDGPVQAGTAFTWRSGGTEIHSVIAVVRPPEQFVWTGSAFKAHAIHVWNLQRLPDGHTLVKTSESMNGFLLSLFYSTKQLHESHLEWLSSLKQAAEKSLN